MTTPSYLTSFRRLPFGKPCLALIGFLSLCTSFVHADLVAHWRLEEGSGTTTADSSGNGLNGTLVAGPSWATSDLALVRGGTTAAVAFDGTDDQIQIVNYKGISGTGARTIAAWIRTDPSITNYNRAIVSWGKNVQGKKWTFRVQDFSGAPGPLRIEAAGGFLVGNAIVTDGEWHHVAVTWANDNTPDIVDAKLYVDGMLDAAVGSPKEPSNFGPVEIDTAFGEDVRLGSTFVSGRHWHGWMDDVRIYDEALSAAEILQLSKLHSPARSQLGEDIDGEAVGDQSGRSVAMSADGTRLAVGAPNNDGNGGGSGHVRVYQWDEQAEVWNLLGTDIDGEAANDGSGWSVAMSADGTRLAVGAPFNADNGFLSGHVRVYQWDEQAEVWNQLGTDIDGEEALDLSGNSVAMSADGTRLAVGADNNDDGSGHVRVYQWDEQAEVWNQLGEDIDGEAEFDRSGSSVAMSADGTRLAVGADNNDGNDPDSNSGHVRVYQWDEQAEAWNQLGADIDGEAAGDQSGWSVAMSVDGTRLAVGAPGNDVNDPDSNSGHVRVYQWDEQAEVWNQLGTDIDGEVAVDGFGWSVAMSADGTRLAVGASEIDDGNAVFSGHVRVYQWDEQDVAWNQLGEDIDGEAEGDLSGRSVAMSADGTRLAIGAHKNDGNDPAPHSDSGHVRVYQDHPHIVVYSFDDAGLRGAIDEAHQGQTIVFHPALTGGTIHLESPLLVSKSLTIDGSNLPNGVTLDGFQSGQRLIEITSGAEVHLKSLTFTHGKAVGSFPHHAGGAIYNNDGDLTVEACTFAYNQAGSGGAIRNHGSLTIERSTFAENSATIDSGAIFTQGPTSLRHVTVVRNRAPHGGGLWVLNGSLTITNSVVALNQGPVAPDLEVSGSSVSATGVNLLSSLSGSQLTPGPAVLVNPDPQLSPLGHYGGPSMTIHPLAGSPLIDASAEVVGTILADSQLDWSEDGTQGFGGWHHGYYDRAADGNGTYSDAEFAPFLNDGSGTLETDPVEVNHWDGSSWKFESNPPWTTLDRERGHPNGANNGEQWAMRRWVATTDADVQLSIHLAKHNVGGAGSGTTVHLFQNGVELGSLTVGGQDGTGLSTLIPATVTTGDRIDLALSPEGIDGDRRDFQDSSIFRLTVFRDEADQDQRGFDGFVGAGVDIGAVEAGPSLLVTTNADAGPGSLREAIGNATVSGQRILFDPTLFDGQAADVITLTSGQIDLEDKNLIIDADDLPAGVTISGGNNSRIFSAGPASIIGMHALTLTDGKNAVGGGAINHEGKLTLHEMDIVNNVVDFGNPGGGIQTAGALAHLILHRSRVNNNSFRFRRRLIRRIRSAHTYR